MYDILRFYIFYTNNATDFLILNSLVIENILVVFYHSFNICQEKINLYSLTINLMQSIQTLLNRMLVFYKYLLKYFCCLSIFYFFWHMFNTKPVNVGYIITLYIQNYAMSTYWLMPIKIYYICSILYVS